MLAQAIQLAAQFQLLETDLEKQVQTLKITNFMLLQHITLAS